ncbi:MAG: PBP1A family penicillin-binding protein [Prevotella sp.]|nr:PBP1A family penicillin-binding protein [Staphylococcus sp.]MCM1350212.1 PBP1A family penicillin-binding protein [Prevotella sp.]
MKKKKKRKVFRFLIVISIFIFSAILITLCIITSNMDYTLPEVMNVELYDSEGKKYLSYCNGKKQSYAKLEDISPYLIDAFISIEDKRFYDHQGLDIIRIGGALLKNLKSNRISEGASTITQQYVKNIYLTNEKTWKRKINEMMIAIQIEKKYEKDQILEGYLNSIYFDHGIYGVEDASIFYFGKSSKDLTLVEACAIASIPKGPTLYSPIRNPEKNKERRNLILDELYQDQKIDESTLLQAKAKTITCIGNNPNDDDTSAPYFQDLVLNELKKIPEINGYRFEGLKVHTTLQLDLYTSIVDSINKRAPETEIETAVYAMDPTTGHVLAVVGGRNYEKSNYNRAVSCVRQPGSSIKPFLYLTALEQGFTVSTAFMSEATTFYLGNETYSPTNFQSIYANFDISMVYALATSDNIYAMKTHLFLGMDKMVSTLKRFGFSGDIPAIPSLALGTHEVSVQELTEAYATLANLGLSVTPTIITKITDMNDHVIYESKPKQKRIAESTDVYLLNEAMTSIFDNRMTYNIRPTGVSIKSLLSTTYSAKSGSTDTDNWMVGYNPDIVVSVWTGYDDARPVEGLEDTKFGKYIWADSVEAYYKVTKQSPTWYTTPSDVVAIPLSPLTGFYAKMDEYTKMLYFKKSNLPWYVESLYGSIL